MKNRLKLLAALGPTLMASGFCSALPDYAYAQFAYEGSCGLKEVASNDVWAIRSVVAQVYGKPGIRYALNHWDGTSWSFTGYAPLSILFICQASPDNISASGPSDVWAVGENEMGQPAAIHYDGTSWSVVPTPNLQSPGGDGFTGVQDFAPNDVWAVGTETVNNIGQHAYGYVPITEHWDGTRWTYIPPVIPNLHAYDDGPFDTFVSITGTGGNDVWAVGSYARKSAQTSPAGISHALIEHWNGSAWSMVPVSSPGYSTLTSSATLSGTDIVAVGEAFPSPSSATGLVYRWNGSGWSQINTAFSKKVYLDAITQAGPQTLIATGNPVIHDSQGYYPTRLESWNGTNWQTLPASQISEGLGPLNISASSPNDIWLAVNTSNNSAYYQHWNGKSWTTYPAPSHP